MLFLYRSEIFNPTSKRSSTRILRSAGFPAVRRVPPSRPIVRLETTVYAPLIYPFSPAACQDEKGRQYSVIDDLNKSALSYTALTQKNDSQDLLSITFS
jgi:hypothetical protein